MAKGGDGMTQVRTQRPGDDLVSYPGVRARVVAAPAEVAELLRGAHAAGRLVTMTPPEPVGKGRVVVRVELRPLPRPQRRTRRRLAVGAAVGIVATVAVGVAVTATVRWLVEHAAHLGAVLLILTLLWAGAGRAGVCVGLHCPGCRHR